MLLKLIFQAAGGQEAGALGRIQTRHFIILLVYLGNGWQQVHGIQSIAGWAVLTPTACLGQLQPVLLVLKIGAVQLNISRY